jgi:4-hydroxy-tetrahydrodipicolinate synthase
MTDDLADVAAGVLTPFDPETGEIRHDQMAENARWLYEGGLRVFLACANISEYHSLTHEERIETAATVADAIPGDGTVLAGAGGDIPGAVDLARAHQDNGADGIMVMPPDHIFKHEEGLVRYYHRIADAVDVPLVLYNRGVEMSVDLLERVTAHENIPAVKWAIHDVELFAKATARIDGVTWICGMAEPPAPAYYLEGAAGFSAGVTNFEPRLGLALFDALEAGDWDRARELRDAAQPLMDLRSDPGPHNTYPGGNSVQVVKRGLENAGQYGGGVREPLVELSPEETERVDRLYEDLQDELDRLL